MNDPTPDRQTLEPPALALLLLSALLCAACSAGEPVAEQRRGRVLLIGIDGAAPRVVTSLLEAGRLPNLQTLAREGASGGIRAHKPIASPRIWNSVVTGMRPRKHGILNFTYKDADGTRHLYTSKHRKAQTLWGIASEAGLRVGVLNFWNTYPIERVNGVMVSDHLLAREVERFEALFEAVATERTGALIHPSEWGDRLAPLAEADATPVVDFPTPFAEDVVIPRWIKRELLQRRYNEDGALARMAREVSRGIEPDVLMVLLPGIDRIQHYLWGVLEPADAYPPGLQPTPEGRAGGKGALFAYYAYTDALIGALLEDYGPDDLVIVLSDHGFEAGHAYMTLTGSHESGEAIHGVVFMRGPGIPEGTRVKGLTVNDITPTILTWMGLPMSEDMDGEPAPFLNVEPPPRVARYDIGSIEYVETNEGVSGVESEIVEDLRALGYIQE